jgi:hypothetical protein
MHRGLNGVVELEVAEQEPFVVQVAERREDLEDVGLLRRATLIARRSRALAPYLGLVVTSRPFGIAFALAAPGRQRASSRQAPPSRSGNREGWVLGQNPR